MSFQQIIIRNYLCGLLFQLGICIVCEYVKKVFC